MPLLPMNDYSNFEYCLTPDNPAIRQARKSMNKICIPRAEHDDQELEGKELYNNLPTKYYKGKKYICCQKCFSHGIKTKYLKSSMIPIERHAHRIKKTKLKHITFKQYLCAECAETYTPHSERVGGKTY
jgi:hypothetical protein